MSALEPKHESESQQAQAFNTTHWSVVLAAGHSSAQGTHTALEKLCRTYWYPLYAYVRRRGHSAHDAQDLTQEFFSQLLATKFFKLANRERGKFRSFLLAALKNFLVNEWDRAQAQKRGGNHILVSLDEPTAEERYLQEPASDDSPDKIFERRWALTLLEQALRQLRKECAASGKAVQFDQLKTFLSGETGDGEYDTPAARLGMKVEAVAVAVHRLRHRYRELVKAEIANTVETPAEAREEMRYLFATLSS